MTADTNIRIPSDHDKSTDGTPDSMLAEHQMSFLTETADVSPDVLPSETTQQETSADISDTIPPAMEQLTLQNITTLNASKRRTMTRLNNINQQVDQAMLDAVKHGITRYQIARHAKMSWSGVNKRLRKLGWVPSNNKPKSAAVRS